jgi:arylsulfatase A-like enzyme
MGQGDVSGYNPASKVKTPAMDALIKEGIRFTDAHSNSSVCTPTRYGILTGRYAWRSRLKSGVLGGGSPHLIEEGRMTVAGMLRQKGYKTAAVGKWHLGLDWKDAKDWSKGFANGPTAKGFDYFYGISASLDMNEYAYLENEGVVEAPTDSIAGSAWPSFWRAGRIAPHFKHVEVLPAMAEKAVDWVKRQRKAAPAQPFFLYLALPSPHTPHVPSAGYTGRSEAGVRGDYVAATDGAIGRFRAALDSLGLSANTIVIVTADNGAHDKTFKQFGHTPHMAWRGEKADIFEAGHRVPFIVKWPGVAKANSTSGETVCLTDFLATAAAIVSYKLQDGAGEDSYSMLPVLLGRKLAAPLREATVHHSINGTFAIRQAAWKLTLDNMGSGGFTAPDSVAGPGTLYDLISNPGEAVAQDQYAAKPAVVRDLKALLARYKADGRSMPLPRQDEFWQEPTALRGPQGVAGFRMAGNRLVFTGASGSFRATLAGMDGRMAWSGTATARNGEAAIDPAGLKPGIYTALLEGPGWTARSRVTIAFPRTSP